jgi:hypothetical protein
MASRLRVGVRPAGLLAAAIVLAVGTFAADAAGLLPGSGTTGPGNPTTSIGLPDGPVVGADDGLARLDRAIGVWTATLADDRGDFLSASQLAVAYYQRGRLTGNLDDYVRAEAATTAALNAYPGYTAAAEIDAVLRYSLHDFAGARAAAQQLYGADASDDAALATLGDADLELGRYDDAGSAFTTLASSEPGAAVSARQAHLASLDGDPATADQLAAAAAQQARAAGVSGASLSWYDYLVGFLAFQNGELGASETAYRQALVDWPGSYLAMAGLAKTVAAEGDLTTAIGLDRQAIAIIPQPQFLSDLGDLYAATGQPVLAQQQYATVAFIGQLAATQRQVYNRQLVLFDVNHGVHLTDALTLATSELAVRKDIYGWDAYAWALLANGQPANASAAMANAMQLGTQDALLDYHAGMIAAAVGQTSRARALLTEALALNPGFDILQAQRARSTLAGLPG